MQRTSRLVGYRPSKQLHLGVRECDSCTRNLLGPSPPIRNPPASSLLQSGVTPLGPFAESVPDQLSTCDEAPRTCRTWRMYYTENTALIYKLFGTRTAYRRCSC